VGITLYLLETRAKNDFVCPSCDKMIVRGTPHFRHDPIMYAQMHRGQRRSHWCRDCILACEPGPKEQITRRLRVPAARVMGRLYGGTAVELLPIRVQCFGIGRVLAEKLAVDASLVHAVSPEQFEEFVCDRFFAMGLEPRRTGAANRKDGGIDVLFWPRMRSAFPFLGAAQIKHYREPKEKVGPAIVREFAGAIAGHPINAGLIVTNTRFSADAVWFARERSALIRLRDLADIRRWLLGNFSDDAEWREVPSSIELCPGIVIDLR
jgi:Restriction endonuclease